MAAQTCSRCGAALRDGVCPNGHPQRVARRRRRGRRWGRTIAVVLLIILLAGATYAGLTLYPRRVAGDAMAPASDAYAAALSAYEELLAAYPSGAADIEEEAAAVLAAAEPARQALGQGQAALDANPPPRLPVLGARPPLSIAEDAREEMAFFYTGALELVADVEGIARYLAELAPTLPKLENVRRELGNPATPAEIDRATAGALAIASQLMADLRAVNPPEEMSPVHASLRATARAIRRNLEEIDRISRQGRSPVLRALIDDVESRIRSYRDTLAAAPDETREAALGAPIAALQRTAGRIAQALGTLRDVYEVEGLTVPS